MMNRGNVFAPKSKELIIYLRQKINGTAHPPNNEIIEELNFYEYTPQQLSEWYAGSAVQGKLYFFTRVFRKHPNSNNTIANRTVRNVGVWKHQNKSSEIRDKNQKIGTRLLLNYNEGEVGSNVFDIITNWVMEEYKTGQPSAAGATLYDWVLCKLYERNINIHGNAVAVAVPNNQANQAVEHPIEGGDVEQDLGGGNNNVDGTVTQQSHPHVQQNNNNNNSSVHDDGTNVLMTNRPCKLLTWKGTGEVVAEGSLLSVDPLSLVGGVALGAFCCAVSVSRVVKDEEVFRYAPKSNFHSLEDAIGGTIAWPHSCIVVCPPCTLFDWVNKSGAAVAEATVACQDPSTVVYDWPLGEDCWKVTLTRVLSNDRLFREMPDGATHLNSALVGRDTMWPIKFILLN